MMRKLRHVVVLAAIGLLSAGVTLAAAQTGAGPRAGARQRHERMLNRQGGPGAMMQGERLKMLADRLGLTADQQEAIKKLQADGQRRRLEYQKNLMRLRNELRGEMLKDDPDAQRVQRLSEQIGSAQTQLRTSRLTERLALRKVLTPEQRDQLMMMRMRHGGWGRHGAWSRPGGEGGHRWGRGGGRGWSGDGQDGQAPGGET